MFLILHLPINLLPSERAFIFFLVKAEIPVIYSNRRKKRRNNMPPSSRLCEQCFSTTAGGMRWLVPKLGWDQDTVQAVLLASGLNTFPSAGHRVLQDSAALHRVRCLVTAGLSCAWALSEELPLTLLHMGLTRDAEGLISTNTASSGRRLPLVYFFFWWWRGIWSPEQILLHGIGF